MAALLVLITSYTHATETTLINQLPTSKNMAAKAAVIEQITDTMVLQALLDAQLYYRKDNKQVVLAIKEGKQFRIHPVFDSTATQLVAKRAIKKITINNRIRQSIRTRLATLGFTAADANERLAAIHTISQKTITPATKQLLLERLPQETDTDVRQAIAFAINIANLTSTNADEQRAAIQAVQGSLNPVVKTTLQGIQTDDPALQEAVRQALRSIEQNVLMSKVAEHVFFGISYGAILVLVAIGLAITFGVMGVINMAHGELVMLGAYTAYVMQLLLPNHIGLALLLAIPMAFVVSAVFGMVIEVLVVRHLQGRLLETLLATFGVSLILQQLVRSIFSPLNRPVSTPDWLAGSWVINDVLSLSYNRIFIIGFCAVVFALLYLLMKKTRLGLEVRAVSQDRQMASAMGIATERVNMLTFAYASGIAGMAGVALSQLTNVGPNLGQSFIIDSFMVVVFGGVGNVLGTLASGLSIGVVSKMLEPWVGAVIAKILLLVGIIIFIQRRPRGLFPQKGRAAE